MQEIWKEVKGYEGIYEVSNLGKIKSLERVIVCKNGTTRTVKSKILHPKKSNSGYLEVNLINKMKYVHRLVATAFIPNIENKPTVNHKDENKTNNKATNLEWMTDYENVNYGTGKQRRVEKYRKKVFQYTMDGKFVREWDCSVSCAESGFSPCNIRRCCHGQYSQHKGYKWSYDPPEQIMR